MIGILGFANLRIMQYLNKYTDILDKHNMEYEVVYWNRDMDNEEYSFNGKVISFDYALNTYQPFYKKIVAFIKYSIFMLKTIKEKKYDKLIVLTTQTAIPLYRLLLRKYKDKYIYDYRDITKEKYGFYKKMVKKLIANSSFTAISSFGFKKVIGESNKFIMSHNCSNLVMDECKYEPKEKIHIAFWGIVRNPEYNKKICDLLGNDKRFTLIYHGTGAYTKIRDYCNEKGYKNISCTGRYNREQIKSFADNTDIILCAYPNDGIMDLAMPVKVYDAVRYAKPLILGTDLYMTDYMKCYNISFELDITNFNTGDELYAWFSKLDKTKLIKDLARLCDNVTDDDMIFEKELICFATL